MAASFYYGALAQTLVNLGYPIVPILPGSKRPAGGNGWRKKAFGPSDPQFAHCGVGIQCGVSVNGSEIIYPADVDIAHEGFVTEYRRRVAELIGPGVPVRIGRAPRELLVFRAAESGWPKAFSSRFNVPGEDKPAKVEFLGDGQQFVSHHIHPDTGEPYAWTALDISELMADDIPVITLEQRDALIALVDEVAAMFPELKKLDSSRTPALPQAKASTAPDEDGVVDAWDSKCPDITLDNCLEYFTGYNGEYQSWVNYGMALHWQFEGSDEALDKWDEWSQSIPGYVDRSDLEKRWAGFGRNSDRNQFTFRSVIKEHKAYMEAHADDNFKEIMAEIVAFDGNRPEVFVSAMAKKVKRQELKPAQTDVCLKELKRVTKVSMAAIRDEMRERDAGGEVNPDDLETHNALAKKYLAALEKQCGGVRPVGTEGQLFVYDPDGGIWRPRYASDSADKVAESGLDGLAGCTRRSDYISIASQAFDLTRDDNDYFFDGAPVGLSCRGYFYSLDDNGKVKREALKPEHRQKHTLKVVPQKMPTPEWDTFLRDTFETPDGAHWYQVGLLQEIMGATITGSMAKYEKAVLFFGGGRAGKGTVTKILEELIPRENTCNVEPYNFSREYYIISLLGKKFNVVGELDQGNPIPGAMFKAITGRDIITGRHPGQRPVSFRNSAAHIFSSNHLLPTADTSMSFFARWIIVEFPNSRLLSGANIDSGLAKRIIATELPGILYWSLEGAQRLEARGEFEQSPVHDHIVRRWRARNDSVLEFFIDGCDPAPSNEMDRNALYQAFNTWCVDAGRKPIMRAKFTEALEDGRGAMCGVRYNPAKRTVSGVAPRLITDMDSLDDF